MLCDEKKLIFLTCVTLVAAQNVEDSKLVTISQGPVRGYRNAEHDIYEFFGIPYATAPNGTLRFTVSTISSLILIKNKQIMTIIVLIFIWLSQLT